MTNPVRAEPDAPGEAPPLSASERKKADEAESLNAAATHEVIRREGIKELERPAGALAWSGLAAGLAMGLSALTEALLRSHLPDAPWRPLITKLGYPVGFLVVILGSKHLFTENTLTPMLPLLAHRTRAILGKVLKLWGIVLAANLVGGLCFAWVAGTTEAFTPEVRQALTGIGREAMEPPALTILLRAVFAGWLIALMVWMLPAAKGGQVAVITIMAWLVGIGSFAHVIVGSIEVMFLAVTGVASWGECLGHYVIPTLVGNTAGGVVLVAMVNHQQVTAGE
jgi:formate/nitrite transporter FocA (FNT family)